MNKLIFAVLAACIGVGSYLLWQQQQPENTRIPGARSPVEAVSGKLGQLPQADRVLVVGYLLRQRGEVPSFSATDSGPFTARTFAEALKLQKAFLEKPTRSPDAVVRTGLQDAAARPLREAVDLTGMELLVAAPGDGHYTPVRRSAQSAASRSMRYGGRPVPAPSAPPPPLPPMEQRAELKTIVFLRNVTDVSVEVSGAVQVRGPSGQHAGAHAIANCRLTKATIPPLTTERVECALDRRTSQAEALLELAEEDRFLVWYPWEIRFANGRSLSFNADAAVRHGKLWGFYALEDK